jgi:hypothetical protein
MSGVNGISEKELEARSQFGGSGVSLTPVAQPYAEPVKMSQGRIIKNLVVISLGFLCLFTSFSSLSNLQSSLNKEEGLGVGGLAVIYAALVVSCLLTPPVIIAR